MTETVHSGSGESNVKCSDPESVERLTLSDTMPKNSNCESLGQNALEFDCLNRDSEPLGQTMVIRNGNDDRKQAESGIVEQELVGELSPNYKPTDSNQDQKSPEFEDCREDSKTGQMEFPSTNEATNSTVEYLAEPLQVLSAEYVTTDSNNEQNIPSLEDWGQNSKIDDNVGISSTIESSIQPPKELPTGHIFTDSNLEQKNLPLKNWGLHSNREMALPSEEKDTSPVEYPAEPPSGVNKNLNLEQLKETHKDAVEIPSEPLKQKSENDEATDSNNEQKIPTLEDLGQNSKIEDNVGTSSTIESSIEPPKELPTRHTFTDSNLEQKNLPLKNWGLHSNLEMSLPSEEKDTSPVEYTAEPPSGVNKNLNLEQLKETQKDAVEIPSEPLEQKSENDENLGERTIVTSFCNKLLLSSGEVAVNSSLEQKGSVPEVLTVNSSFQKLESLHENEEAISIVDNLAEVPGDASKNPGQDLSKSPRDSNENATQLECGDKRPTGCSRKRKATLGSPVISTRVLRSRTQEKSKPVEPVNASADNGATDEKKRKRRKIKQRKQIAVNEFSGIKRHLRYVLHRIQYEQSFIDAYSGEGWKGQSLEKIKPEKELQLAKSRIFHYKLKIRDLFQRIDTSLSQGRFPESLYDSEGQIDSEDIFCAKCGSKDLPADNDIILCDGACERGFHQFCLEPPLLKEDIPQGDEGWLCPGCDCKVDCIDLLNDLLGTDLSVTDSCEKVFPEEAAAAASGKQLDDISGLPSDDSDDDDYNPDNLEVQDNVSQDESSSDENDSSDASFVSETTPNDELLLGLPSEDSEDDDYDPDAPDHDEQVMQGLPSEVSEDDDYDPDAPDHDEQVMQDSSSSDFSSDSEDFGVVFENNTSPGQDQCEKIEVGGAKQHSLKDEASYLLHSNAVLASGKRKVERMDYKKLHDETYGISSSDSSDEDYEDNPAPKRRKQGNDRAALNSSDQSPVDAMDKNFKQNEVEHTANRRACKKLNTEGLVVSGSGSSSKRNFRFGEDAIKRLNESFKENHYPKRDVKESLARELGLTLRQIDKWFCNTRWSFHHPSAPKESTAIENPPKSGVSSPQMKDATPDVQEGLNEDAAIQETGVQKHTSPESKTRSNADNQASNQSSKTRKSKKKNTQVDIANSQRARRSNRQITDLKP